MLHRVAEPLEEMPHSDTGSMRVNSNAGWERVQRGDG